MSILAKVVPGPTASPTSMIHRQLKGQTLAHIMTASVVALSSIGHAQAIQPGTARCESVVNDGVERMLKDLDPVKAEHVRRDLAGSKAPWTEDRTYARVRDAVAQIPNARALIRLEIAGGKGPGYKSLWFVDSGDKVFEFSTGSGGGDYWRGTLPREQWDSYTKYLKSITQGDLGPIVSETSVDAAVYFMCLLVDGREIALIVEDNPDDRPQFSIVARTLALSRSMVVPRELQPQLLRQTVVPVD
jgi:hypothetical protein